MRASLLAFALLIASRADAAPPEPAGQHIVEQGSSQGAPACVACHGPQLQGADAFKAPGIAGRPAAYILARLEHYAGPTGHNALMKQVAQALSPADRQAVAAYIAGLPPQFTNVAPAPAPH